MYPRWWRALWAAVWNASEASGIGLGRFAPWVFEQMIGARGVRVR